MMQRSLHEMLFLLDHCSVIIVRLSYHEQPFLLKVNFTWNFLSLSLVKCWESASLTERLGIPRLGRERVINYDTGSDRVKSLLLFKPFTSRAAFNHSTFSFGVFFGVTNRATKCIIYLWYFEAACIHFVSLDTQMKRGICHNFYDGLDCFFW